MHKHVADSVILTISTRAFDVSIFFFYYIKNTQQNKKLKMLNAHLLLPFSIVSSLGTSSTASITRTLLMLSTCRTTTTRFPLKSHHIHNRTRRRIQ